MPRPPSRLATALAPLALLIPGPAPGSEPSPGEIDSAIRAIKKEGLENSQVMKTALHLTEVIGPRLTNSPGMKRANEWTRDAMKGWGLANAEVEPWGEFGRGWSLKRFSLQVVEPQSIPLIALPYAWSPGLEGPATGPVVRVEAQAVADLEKYKGKLRGALVILAGGERLAPARFEPEARRLTDEQLLRLANAAPPPERKAFRPRRQQQQGGAGQEKAPDESRARLEFPARQAQFLIDEGAVALLRPARSGDHGTLFVEAATVPSPAGIDPAGRPRAWSKDAPKALPQVAIAPEHYNRIVRLLAAEVPVKVAIELSVQFHDDDTIAYNTVAEIPGTDLKDELVMIGGHLDSWHGGTGATDNAAGCAVAMEAARILMAAKLQPRRTIRVALWSGEEQGLLGSRAYVEKHFGRVKEDGRLETTPAYDKFCGYFNFDNGTGKIRGIHLQGDEAARPVFRQFLEPFRDLGAATISASNTGGTDHLSFDGIGLPGFQFIQDPIDYDGRTHHSNMDTYDRLQADDLKQSAVVMAAFAYRSAMRDERLPRKPLPESQPAAATAGGGE